MIHALKQETNYFQDVKDGKKLFEVRLNDRDYKTGDILVLNEIDDNGNYTGRSMLVWVDYILKDFKPLNPNYVIMSIKPCVVSPLYSPSGYSVPLVTLPEDDELPY